jgi:hypothetical protein
VAVEVQVEVTRELRPVRGPMATRDAKPPYLPEGGAARVTLAARRSRVVQFLVGGSGAPPARVAEFDFPLHVSPLRTALSAAGPPSAAEVAKGAPSVADAAGAAAAMGAPALAAAMVRAEAVRAHAVRMSPVATAAAVAAAAAALAAVPAPLDNKPGDVTDSYMDARTWRAEASVPTTPEVRPLLRSLLT